MSFDDEVDYTVVFIFPGYGTERENAETIVESALEWLNNNKEEPGFRFAPSVSAHLQIVQDTDEARVLMETDDSVAMILMHDVPDFERDALLLTCLERDIGACYTEHVKRLRKRRRGPMQVVFSKEPSDEPPAHKLVADTLIGPVAEDEETGSRIGEVIAVIALSVMTHHWRKCEPTDPFSDLDEE